MSHSESKQILLVARKDGEPGFDEFIRTVYYIDHYGRARTRGIVQWSEHAGDNRWWIVARHLDPDGWVLEISVGGACKGGHKTLKYRNYLERTGQIDMGNS